MSCYFYLSSANFKFKDCNRRKSGIVTGTFKEDECVFESVTPYLHFHLCQFAEEILSYSSAAMRFEVALVISD